MLETNFVVSKLVASCRWNCGLGKLSTILEMKILRRQLYMQLPIISSLQIQLFNLLFLLSTFIKMTINFIRVSPTGFVLSTQPLAYV